MSFCDDNVVLMMLGHSLYHDDGMTAETPADHFPETPISLNYGIMNIP